MSKISSSKTPENFETQERNQKNYTENGKEINLENNNQSEVIPENEDENLSFASSSPLSKLSSIEKPSKEIFTQIGENGKSTVDFSEIDNSNLSWWQKQTIRWKATTLGILIGVIPTIILGGFSLFLTSREFENQIYQNLEEISTDSINALDIFLQDRVEYIKEFSKREIFTNSQIAQILGAEGQKEALNKIDRNFSFYDIVAIIDGDNGEVLIQSDVQTGGILSNQKNQDYFTKLNEGNQSIVIDSHIETNKKSYIYIASKIQGDLNRILVTRIPADRINKLFSSFQEDKNIYVVNNEYEIISSKNEEEIEDSIREKYPTLDNKIIELESKGVEKPQKILLKESLNNQDDIFVLNSIPETEEEHSVDWYMLVAEDVDIAFQGQRQLTWILVLEIIVTLVIVAVVAIIIINRFTRPLVDVANTLEDMGQGNLNARINIKGKDELAIVGKNINNLVSKIQGLIQEQKLSAVQSDLLKNITLKMAEALDTTMVFDIAVEQIRQTLQSDRVIVYRFDENWQGKIIAESVGENWPKAIGATINDPCFADRYVDKYKKGRVQATPDIYEAGLTECHIQQLEPFAVKANLVAPIIVDNNLVGLLIAHQCSAPRYWEKGEIEFFGQIATQIGPAVERTILLEKQRIDAELSKGLKDITIGIAAALNTEAVFDIAVSQTRLALNADRVIVYRFDQDWLGEIIAESVEGNWPQAIGNFIKDPCFADKYVDKYQKGRVKATTDIYNAGLTECHLQQLEPFGVKANLVAPILLQDELMGLFIAHQCSGPREWQQAEIDFMAQIATQIGPALERVVLVERLQEAEEEQRQARENIQQRALELLMQVDPVSQGDLTIRAQVTEDEIGTIADSYNATIESLRRIVNQVQQAALQVARVTIENEGSIGSLSTEAMRQADDINKVLDRIQGLTASARNVATNAEQAEAAVQLANESVSAGEVAMNRTVDGILAIRETVAETAKKVKRLGESSQRISKVVNLIGSFADQTNLLALNASIEAAHAGEEGRGFAVVAEEVRSLARQSAEATAEIEKVVVEIQEETNEVVKAMEAGTEQVVTGTKLVEETRASLNQITAASAQINQLVTAIAAAATEQSLTSEEVTETMTDVASISNNTSMAASDVTDSFKELLKVAQKLQDSVGKFKVN